MKVVYHIGKHDDGWAYRVGEVWSEAFPRYHDAMQAAKSAAARQHLGGQDAEIQFQDDQGVWHSEHVSGGDRPDTEVLPN